MKNVFNQILFVFLGLFSSCIPDHCKDTVCNNGGVCVDGNCSCLNGYEGINCSEIWNERFIGSWNTTDVSQTDITDTLKYTASIVSNGSPSQFMVLNLGNAYDSILCKRTSYSAFTIFSNQIIDSTVTIQSGSGYYDSIQHKVFASYVVMKNNTSSSFTIILSK